LVWKQNQYLVLRCRKRHSCCNFSYDFAFHLVLSSKLSDPEISTISIIGKFVLLRKPLHAFIISCEFTFNRYYEYHLHIGIDALQKSHSASFKRRVVFTRLWSLNLRVLISILRLFLVGLLFPFESSVQFKFLVFSDYWSLNTDYC
jgi:hypothetical protein